MKEKIETLNKEYFKQLVYFYGKQYNLSKNILDKFYNENVEELANCFLIKLIVEEKLFYITYPNTTYEDYFNYKYSEKGSKKLYE